MSRDTSPLQKRSEHMAHPRSNRSLVKDPIRYKTVMCTNWTQTGACPYGFKCQFAHGKEELRGRGKKSAKATTPPRKLSDASSSDENIEAVTNVRALLAAAALEETPSLEDTPKCSDQADCSEIRCNRVTGKVELALPPGTLRQASHTTNIVRRQISSLFADEMDEQQPQLFAPGMSIWAEALKPPPPVALEQPHTIPVPKNAALMPCATMADGLFA